MPQRNPTSRSRNALSRSWWHRVHRDDRGNLGVLLLMTVWALVVLIAMVWNTGEYATRRRYVQTAADSAAHAGNLWVSRTTNLTAASNMVISENGSAEAILRSVEPTRQTIQSRFDSERRRAKELLNGDTLGQPEKQYPDCEYFEELVGFGAWEGKGRGDTLNEELTALTPQLTAALKRVLPLLLAPEAARLKREMADGLLQNTAALDWLLNTYLAAVGPPVKQWITGAVRPRLTDVLKTLDAEQSTLDQWTTQTAPATSGMTVEQLQQARQEIFDYQQQLRNLTPRVVEQQRAALAAFYKCDITYSTPGHRQEASEPAVINAPIGLAEDVESQTHTDGIRERYPAAAAARFRDPSPFLVIDPINVNVDRSVIWHPGSSFTAPPGIVLKGQEFTGTFWVGGGEWGQVPCAPLASYFNDRVWRDLQGLRKEPQAIDRTRSELGGRILPVPAAPSVDDLPRTFTTTGSPPQTISLPPARIPSLPTPPGLKPNEVDAINALNARSAQFNTDVRKYVQDLRGLGSAVRQMYQHMAILSQRAAAVFADATWLRYVEHNRNLVLREMGVAKEFMVLGTYALRSIPDWAVNDMHQDVYTRIYRIIYDRNIGRVTREVRARLLQWAQGILDSQPGQGRGRGSNRGAANDFANRYASQIAQYIVSHAADLIATEVADEWVLRPWPYEITPPQKPVPPTAGLTDDERKHRFTFLAAATTTTDTGARPLLRKAFNANTKPLVAFSQAENFNWMEFDEGYGAGDKYDAMTFYGHGNQSGSPRPWRLSTTGGWNWQPRLALADAMAEALEDGQQFREFLEKGGVSGNDSDAINTLTLH